MSYLIAENPNTLNDTPVVNKIGGRSVESFTNQSCPQRRGFVSVSPSTAISSNVLAGAAIEFRIENNIDRIGAAYLRVDYTNSSGANFVCSTPMLWLSSIQIFANSGSTQLYQTNDPVSNFLINNVLMSREEHETTAALRGTSATYASGTLTIPTGQSGSLYIAIAENFWRSLHLRTYTIDGNILVRLQFQPSNNIIVSGTWSTTNVLLELSGYYESAAQKKLMTQKAEVPKIFSYYSPQVTTASLTLAASSQYQIRLSGINGWVNQIYFVIRQSAYATDPANQLSFVQPSSFDILDQAGKSTTGYKSQTVADMVMMYSPLYNNVFINNTNAMVYSYSQTPQADILTGSWNGGIRCTGYHILQFTTPSTLVGGSYDVLVYGLCNESLIIENAMAKTTRA